MRGWQIVEGLVIDWIKFNKATSTKSLDFVFNPPQEASGITFTLKVTLTDHNEKAASEDYEIKVKV